MNNHIPKISIFTTCRNGAKYIRETLDSIFNQTFEDFEIVLVDSASTDGTIDILKEYKDPRLRWISEPDKDANEGFYKALMLTRGEYVMCMPVSDLYASKIWFNKCVDVLDNDIKTSLVFGYVQVIDENGSFGRINFEEWFNNPPPNEKEYFYYWLSCFGPLPELSYCVRSDVYKKCFPKLEKGWIYNFDISKNEITDIEFDHLIPFLKFRYNFMKNGYLVKFLPIVSSFGRIHSDSRNTTINSPSTNFNKLISNKYIQYIVQYRQDILYGNVKHNFKDGLSNVISYLDQADLRSIAWKISYNKLNYDIRFNYQEKFTICYKYFNVVLNYTNKLVKYFLIVLHCIYIKLLTILKRHKLRENDSGH